MKRLIILRELSEDPSPMELEAAKEMIEFIMAVQGCNDLILDLYSQIKHLIRMKIMMENLCSAN